MYFFYFTGMERRIARLIFTDFCCWIPITTMAFLHFSGIVNLVDTMAVVISAIILLPINSVLNPTLYSSYIDTVFNKVRNAICKCKATEQPQEVTEIGLLSIPTTMTRLPLPSEKCLPASKSKLLNRSWMKTKWHKLTFYLAAAKLYTFTPW